MALNNYLPEITLNPTEDCVIATNRKLKAIWSMEAQNDLRSMHNAQAQSELSSLLASEIISEIDAEILKDLRTNSEMRDSITKGMQWWFDLSQETRDEIIQNHSIFKEHEVAPKFKNYREIDDK